LLELGQPKIFSGLRQKLIRRENAGIRRRLPIPLKGKDFLSNDYLGYAKNLIIQEEVTLLHSFTHAQIGKSQGSTGSRLLSGNYDLYSKLEMELAKYFKAESSLIFNSGFNLNLGIMSSIPQEKDIVFMDEFVHASLKMGARISPAKTYFFRHNDLEHLEFKLKSARKKCTGEIYIVTESIFSMDGDIPNLNELIILAKTFNARIILDEAHAGGILGPHGEGLAASLNLKNIAEDISIRIITFSKAFGSHGAVFLGPELIKNYLINFCLPFIYTTALPPHTILSIKKALEYRRKNKEEVKLLNKNIQIFNSLLQLKNPISPIFSFPLGEIKKLKQISQKLTDKGFQVIPIFSPTVKRGSERLRITLHSYNSRDEMDQLIQILKENL
jgi:8-amino-7-oxononanoate synthase